MTSDLFFGAALGDALAMPIDGLSHQNVRFFYKGIKGLTASEQFGTPAGHGTVRTDTLRALQHGDAFDGANLAGAAAAAVLGVAAGMLPGRAYPDGLPPDVQVAARLVERALAHAAARPFDSDEFWAMLVADALAFDRDAGGTGQVPARMQRLAGKLDRFPLDLIDVCGGGGSAPDEAIPFALAMFARNPDLVEATLLSAINAGGDPATTGTVVGALLAARHGVEAFPDEWQTGLANVE